MSDYLVLSSYEALYVEQTRLRRYEAELNEQLLIRGALLKREELANHRQHVKLIAQVEMLRCESTCLQALIVNDRETMIACEHRFRQMSNDSRLAATERKECNSSVAEEIRRLTAEISNRGNTPNRGISSAFTVIHSEDAKMEAVMKNCAELAVVRSTLDSCVSRHQMALRRLEEAADKERERHMQTATELSRICSELKAQVLHLREELRKINPPELAVELFGWVGVVTKMVRTKVRWDFAHQICMLNVVAMEGLRLQLRDMEGKK
jgi:predicted  nucleic acid-binding Zn-ribbon protein